MLYFGIFVGFCLGVFFVALCNAARQGDGLQNLEDAYRQGYRDGRRRSLIFTPKHLNGD